MALDLTDLLTAEHPPVAETSASVRPDLVQLYDAYAPFVWRTVRRLGVPDSAVEDAVQDVFLAVHRRLGDYVAHASVRSWLYGFALRVARNYRRSARRRRQERPQERAPEPVIAQLATPAEQHLRVAAARRLYRLLDELTPEQREVFVMAELEELNGPEIAELLGANLNCIYARLRAARQQFNRAAARLRAQDEREGR